MSAGEEAYMRGTIKEIGTASLASMHVPGYFGDGGSCKRCGGFIGEPNKAYGYAGRWCHCGQNSHPHDPSKAELEGWFRELNEKQVGPIPTPAAQPTMTPAEFVIWLKGFFAGRTANPTDPKLEQLLRDTLGRVK